MTGATVLHAHDPDYQIDMHSMWVTGSGTVILHISRGSGTPYDIAQVTKDGPSPVVCARDCGCP